METYRNPDEELIIQVVFGHSSPLTGNEIIYFRDCQSPDSEYLSQFNKCAQLAGDDTW